MWMTFSELWIFVSFVSGSSSEAWDAVACELFMSHVLARRLVR